LRVFTELVQTDVMVFDKQGRFVEGLKKEDFELRIDGKPKPVEFFERITAGTANEEFQLASARGSSLRSARDAGIRPLDRGRPIFFYVDDLHLDLTGLVSTRKLLHNFIDKEMGQNDEVAITSATGQIGFLSQLTNNKSVLRAAAERLKMRSRSARDSEFPVMTEYQAFQISNYDRDVTGYFVDYILSSMPGITRESAEEMVRTRAQMMLSYAANVTTNTLSGLQSLVHSANKITGRKLVFFISDGFLLDSRNSETKDRLRRITSVAARNGVVIYSIDSRGLVAGYDASDAAQFDPTGRLSRGSGGERTAAQDGLNALAHDTGGRAVLNTNAMQPAVKRAIQETSTYYLLAWTPAPEKSGSGKFHRIEVRVNGRPDLTVQVRRGFFDLDPAPTAEKKKKENDRPPTGAPNASITELQKVMTSTYPEREIPLSLRASYINTPDKGDVVFATTVVPSQFLTFNLLDGKHTAKVTVIGGIYNEKGEIADSFGKQITMSGTTKENGVENLVYSHPAYLKAGLYQVRVAARDDHTGRAGSAHAWIEIPNVTSGKIALSSVLLGVRVQPSISNASMDPVDFSETELRVGSRFSSHDFLRFMVFVYNATVDPVGSKPDVAIQIQVVREGQPVITAPLKKLSLEGIDDLKRIPYAAEVSLEGLRAGRYVMQISVVDRVAKTSASQQAQFDVE
jgi:VWFA-related protein